MAEANSTHIVTPECEEFLYFFLEVFPHSDVEHWVQDTIKEREVDKNISGEAQVEFKCASSHYFETAKQAKDLDYMVWHPTYQKCQGYCQDQYSGLLLLYLRI